MTILLVDDKECELLLLLFKQFGLSDVHCVASAKEAHQWLAANKADVIITDMAMNGINGDGLSFVEALEKGRYRIGILSGYEIGAVPYALLKESGVERVFLKHNPRIFMNEIVEWLK